MINIKSTLHDCKALKLILHHSSTGTRAAAAKRLAAKRNDLRHAGEFYSKDAVRAALAYWGISETEAASTLLDAAALRSTRRTRFLKLQTWKSS
jgi:hypothetical protein